MGTLHYGSSTFEVDDDTLRHFSAVMVAKLRRHESFLVLVHADDDGSERLWMHPTAHVRIATGPVGGPLEPARVEHMMREANKPGCVDLCSAWQLSAHAVRP